MKTVIGWGSDCYISLYARKYSYFTPNIFDKHILSLSCLLEIIQNKDFDYFPRYEHFFLLSDKIEKQESKSIQEIKDTFGFFIKGDLVIPYPLDEYYIVRPKKIACLWYYKNYPICRFFNNIKNYNREQIYNKIKQQHQEDLLSFQENKNKNICFIRNQSDIFVAYQNEEVRYDGFDTKEQLLEGYIKLIDLLKRDNNQCSLVATGNRTFYNEFSYSDTKFYYVEDGSEDVMWKEIFMESNVFRKKII